MARIQSVFVGVASMSLEPPRRIDAKDPTGRTFVVQTLNLRMADGSVAEVILHFEENTPHLMLSIAPPSDGRTCQPIGLLNPLCAPVIDGKRKCVAKFNSYCAGFVECVKGAGLVCQDCGEPKP